jgi:glycosyltransferase involved in cell wall biosynthesis
MRIAFLSMYDSTDPRQWSGIPRSMALALGGTDADVIPVTVRGAALLRALGAARTLVGEIAGRRYLRDRNPALLRDVATEARKVIHALRPDIVFSPGTLPVAWLECDAPVAFWTDATFARVHDFYPEFSKLAARSVHDSQVMEQQALNRCAAAFYSSAWAARSAVTDYGASPDRVCVAPFGPNLPPLPHTEVGHVIAQRSSTVCRLLFMATGWHRKGGPLAVAAAQGIAEAGVRVELTLVGRIPRGLSLPSFVRVTGWMDKRNPRAVQCLGGLLSGSHFLIFPTQADTTPVSIIEAAAHAVPAVAPDIGGIAEIIRHDATGVLLPADATPSDYAQAILRIWERRDRYEAMAAAAYREHERRLNWPAAAVTVRQHLDALIGGRA